MQAQALNILPVLPQSAGDKKQSRPKNYPTQVGFDNAQYHAQCPFHLRNCHPGLVSAEGQHPPEQLIASQGFKVGVGFKANLEIRTPPDRFFEMVNRQVKLLLSSVAVGFGVVSSGRVGVDLQCLIKAVQCFVIAA